ncbi:hypothetical protein scyTo_0009320 [Scyliorhinus torazame]|uniref:Uncharacterized protein n=1 Tax=Scyliorhinus torazame TaxID=75743 RepID=A0A401NKG0_SCYTO|nr:hypothetical protein [Scyliorhinus torazame]
MVQHYKYRVNNSCSQLIIQSTMRKPGQTKGLHRSYLRWKQQMKLPTNQPLCVVLLQGVKLLPAPLCHTYQKIAEQL